MSVTCDRSMVFSGSSTNKTDRHVITGYNWNSAESGVKHHQTNKQNTDLSKPLISILFHLVISCNFSVVNCKLSTSHIACLLFLLNNESLIKIVLYRCLFLFTFQMLTVSFFWWWMLKNHYKTMKLKLFFALIKKQQISIS